MHLRQFRYVSGAVGRAHWRLPRRWQSRPARVLIGRAVSRGASATQRLALSVAYEIVDQPRRGPLTTPSPRVTFARRRLALTVRECQQSTSVRQPRRSTRRRVGAARSQPDAAIGPGHGPLSQPRRDHMSNIRPLHDRVIVKRVKEEEKTKGGHHHPRHRQGEADRGRSHRRRQRQGPRGRHASGSST